jgi:hypothetical protein
MPGKSRQNSASQVTAGQTREIEMRETLFPQLQDPEARKAVAEVLIALFDRWQLHELNQAQLLGLDSIYSLRRDKMLPNTPAVLERAGHLLAIDRALLKQYPYRSGYRDRWVTIPSEPSDSFGGESPLQVMLTRGIEGIREVQEYLESLEIRKTED